MVAVQVVNDSECGFSDGGIRKSEMNNTLLNINFKLMKPQIQQQTTVYDVIESEKSNSSKKTSHAEIG